MTTAIATWHGAELARSDRTVVVEGNHYFPIDDVRFDHLAPSAHTSVCSWKGTAAYYDVTVAGESNPNAAWYYDDPKPEAAEITGRIAFWKGVEVTVA